MVFENLTTRLHAVFSKIKNKGKVSEDDIHIALREVRLALLEADVNFKVVKQFIATIKDKALGQEVAESFTPGMVIIDIVNKELTELMGGTSSKLAKAVKGPTTVMMVGLQGAGKTTTTGKLARMLHKQGFRVLLVAADIYRPAAIEQLRVLSEQAGVSLFELGEQVSPLDVAKRGRNYAIEHQFDYVLIDTAGRLHIDEPLMQQLCDMHTDVLPEEVLLVVDAMTGQDAVNVAEHFHRELQLTGIIMTKLDGDTRGGAALSVKAVTGCPIKFVSVGEKLDTLDTFYPDRIASRMLGMGDMLSLIEKAQSQMDVEKTKQLEQKMRNAAFTLDDFLDQMEQMKKLGSMEQIMNMIPGMNKMLPLAKNAGLNEKHFAQIEGMIRSMTKQEKQQPDLINHSRRKRIAAGSGTNISQVNRLLKQFDEMSRVMKQFSTMMHNKGGHKMSGLKQLKGLSKGFKLPFR